MEKLPKLFLKAFRAPEQPELCKEFVNQHRKVLEDFGISHVTTNNERWLDDPLSYVIVALDEAGEMMGGIRLKMATPDEQLPMEQAVQKFDERVHTELEALLPYGNGEVCSLWNANRFRAMGIPILLSQAITALSVQAGAGRMVCLVAHYTKKHPARNGFVVMENVGDNGTFDYPIPSIKAIAMVNPDTHLLHCADDQQRQLLFSLRTRPDQVRIEKPGTTTFEVHYALRLESNLVDLNAYRWISEERLRQTA